MSHYQNNNWLIVIEHHMDAMVDGLILLFTGLQEMVYKQLNNIHIKELIKHVNQKQELTNQRDTRLLVQLIYNQQFLNTQFQFVLMPLTGVHILKVFSTIVLNQSITLFQLLDIMLMELGSSKIHGQQIGERVVSLDQLLETLVQLHKKLSLPLFDLILNNIINNNTLFFFNIIVYTS